MAKPAAIKRVTNKAEFTINMCIYGDPGVGKTRLIGTPGKRTLIVRPPTDHTASIRESEADEWVVKTWKDMEEVYEYLRHEPDAYDWVWLDSISLWQEFGLEDIWEQVLRKRPDRKGQGYDKGEYGLNMNNISRWLRNMATLGEFNFGVVAHTRELPIAEREDSDEKLMPYVQGINMATKLCGYMHIVGYYEVDEKGKRVLRFNASDDYFAKDQLDAFEGGKLVKPTFPAIEKAIKVALGGKTKITKTKTTKTKTTKKRRA